MSWTRFDRSHPKDGTLILFRFSDRELGMGTYYAGDEKHLPTIISWDSQKELVIDRDSIEMWRVVAQPTWWDDYGHPAWALARVMILCCALTVILYFTAKDFDETELRTVIGLFLFGGAYESVFQVIGKLVGRKA